MCYQHTIADCGLSPVVAPVPDRIECADCHTITRYPQSAPDRELCGNCFCEHYIQCEHCNEVVDRNDGQTYDGDDCDYCDTCFDRLFVKCESCDSYHCRDNTYRHNRRNYCESCYHEEFHDCAGCGSTFANDDLSYHEGFENDYCSSCYPCDDEDSDDNGGGECNARRFRFLDDDTCQFTGSLRTYGVELETDKCPDYSDLDGRTYFDAKDDGSINGKEFVSQVLRGDRGLAAIHEFCEKAEDFKVNDSCGYHVHIGVRDLSDDAKRAVCVGYALTESFWFSLVPKARRENRYCRALKWSANQALDSNDFYYFAESQDRYQWFNVAAYAEHKTFEVRLHSGTLEGDKVCNWVKAHVKFVDWCAGRSINDIVAAFSGCTDQERFERMCEIWGEDGLCEFYRARAAKFGFQYRRPAQLACAA
jgi:hypothetical protein